MTSRDRNADITAITFRSVNRPGADGYDRGLQRHHLLPRQLLSQHCFAKLFAAVGQGAVEFDDFRSNGLLLPCTEQATIRTGMPLHRGPHRRYNEVVIARVGRIEERWAEMHTRDHHAAQAEACDRLRLIQAELLAQRRRVLLNRNDPLGTGYDFSELDATAEALWSAE